MVRAEEADAYPPSRLPRNRGSTEPHLAARERETLAALLAYAPGAVLVVDGDSRCLGANAAAAALLGTTLAALEDGNLLDSLPPEARPAVAHAIQRLAAPTLLTPNDEGPAHTDASAAWSTVVRRSYGEQAIEWAPRRITPAGRPLVAIALRDISEARILARRLQTIAHVAAGTAYAGSLEATLGALARSAAEASAMPACLIWTADTTPRLARVHGLYGLPEGYGEALERVAATGIALASGEALHSGEPVIVPLARRGMLDDPVFAPLHPYLREMTWESLGCAPLIYGERRVGVLVGHYPQPEGPGAEEITFLRTIADQAAVAVENARLVAEVEEQREAEYRSIFEATSDGLVVSTLDGIHEEINPAYAALHGYSREEMLAMHPSMYVHPDSIPELQAFIADVAAGRPHHSQAVDIRKDGTPFYIDVRGVPIMRRGVPHILGVLRDITDQVQAYRLLEQRVDERTRELAMLLEVSGEVNSTLELEPLLDLILAQFRTVVEYRDANILMLEGDDLVFVGYWGPYPSAEMIGRRISLAHAEANRLVVERREPVIIADMRGDEPLAISFRQVGHEDLADTHLLIGSWMGLPLVQQERVIGMMGISHSERGFYTPRHARLAMAIAHQAAGAIEHARLYAQAREAAAIVERQRLARELHDSVSQALYGIALGVRTARELLDRDPTRAAEPLDYILSLTRAGLAEMRALIFALRPESLETEGLIAALRHVVTALEARHEITVDATLCEEPEAPIAIKEAIYRVAQEALHNTVKHAQARTVQVRLACDPESLRLEIADDGIGFDPRGSFPGHLGLRSMRERIARVNGTLSIESAPGAGTRLLACVPRIRDINA